MSSFGNKKNGGKNSLRRPSTLVFIHDLPDLERLSCLVLEFDSLAAVQSGTFLSDFHAQTCISRRLVVAERNVVVLPVERVLNRIVCILQSEYSQSKEWQARLDCLGLKVFCEDDVQHDLFAAALSYTAKARLSPSWNVVGRVLVKGSDFFFDLDQRVEAVEMEIFSNNGGTYLSLTPAVVRSKQLDFSCSGMAVSASELCKFQQNENYEIGHRSITQRTCYVLPKLSRGEIVGIKHKVGTNGLLNDYAEFCRYWKDMYNYDLPAESQSLYFVDVVFYLLGPTRHTYPACCVRSRGLEEVGSFRRGVDGESASAAILRQFCADFLASFSSSVCGVAIKLGMEFIPQVSFLSAAKVTSTSNAGCTSTTQEPPPPNMLSRSSLVAKDLPFATNDVNNNDSGADVSAAKLFDQSAGAEIDGDSQSDCEQDRTGSSAAEQNQQAPIVDDERYCVPSSQAKGCDLSYDGSTDTNAEPGDVLIPPLVDENRNTVDEGNRPIAGLNRRALGLCGGRIGANVTSFSARRLPSFVSPFKNRAQYPKPMSAKGSSPAVTLTPVDAITSPVKSQQQDKQICLDKKVLPVDCPEAHSPAAPGGFIAAAGSQAGVFKVPLLPAPRVKVTASVAKPVSDWKLASTSASEVIPLVLATQGKIRDPTEESNVQLDVRVASPVMPPSIAAVSGLALASSATAKLLQPELTSKRKALELPEESSVDGSRETKKQRTAVLMPDSSVAMHVLNGETVKVNAPSLLAWLKSRGVACNTKTKKADLVAMATAEREKLTKKN